MLSRVEGPPSAAGWMWSSSSLHLLTQRRPSGPIHVQVEEELDLDLALAPGQLREAAGEGGGVERGGAGRVQGAPPVMVLSLVPRVFRASGKAPGGLAIAFRGRERACSRQREL